MCVVCIRLQKLICFTEHSLLAIRLQSQRITEKGKLQSWKLDQQVT